MNAAHRHYAVIERVIRYLEANTRRQPGLQEISAHVHLSKFHLQRVFSEWAGVTPKQFLQLLTTERSKALLKAGQSTLQTSLDLGLSGNGRLHDHFITCEAMTPGAYKRGGGGLDICHTTIDSPFGRALVAETPLGICHAAFGDPADNHRRLAALYPAAVFREQAGPHAQCLARYFSDWIVPDGKIHLHFRGTPFQLQVWKALLNIPAGDLVTYGEVGARIGNPGAGRAIGTAVGANPIAYLIPCHRVIRGDGRSGGYRWGGERKRAINGFEAARFGVG